MMAAAAEAAHAGEEHVEAAAFGVSFLTPGFFVALAMLVVFGIMLKARVPALIAGMLDARIGEIRKQLDEAARLRAEAEALKAEYEKKAKEADAEIATFMAAAERQAGEIVDKAKADAAALIERHKKMAEAKIVGAERAAVAEIREKAATAATAAARELIAAKHDSGADKALVDKAIAGI
jgi:F-type H+-transporting ATPase subunit b